MQKKCNFVILARHFGHFDLLHVRDFKRFTYVRERDMHACSAVFRKIEHFRIAGTSAMRYVCNSYAIPMQITRKIEHYDIRANKKAAKCRFFCICYEDYLTSAPVTVYTFPSRRMRSWPLLKLLPLVICDWSFVTWSMPVAPPISWMLLNSFHSSASL